MESEAIGTAASHADFSLFSLIMAADPIVKLVLLFLLLASIWSWMVIGEKLFSLGAVRKKSRQFEEAFWSGRTEDFDMRPGQATNDAASRVFAAAAREWSDAKRLQSGSGDAPSDQCALRWIARLDAPETVSAFLRPSDLRHPLLACSGLSGAS